MFEPAHTNLEAEFLPLAVQVLHLLLQQQDIVCNDVLGQIRLHAAQLRQALSPVLQGDLVLLHTITQRSPQQTVRTPPSSPSAFTLSQLVPTVLSLWTSSPFFFLPLSLSPFSLYFSPPSERGLKATGCKLGWGRGDCRGKVGVGDKGFGGSEGMSFEAKLFQTWLWSPGSKQSENLL